MTFDGINIHIYIYIHIHINIYIYIHINEKCGELGADTSSSPHLSTYFWTSRSSQSGFWPVKRGSSKAPPCGRWPVRWGWSATKRWRFHRWSDRRHATLNNTYPLVNVNKKPWKITIFNGTTHYKWPFSIAMLNYQRVKRYVLSISVHDFLQNCRKESRDDHYIYGYTSYADFYCIYIYICMIYTSCRYMRSCISWYIPWEAVEGLRVDLPGRSLWMAACARCHADELRWTTLSATKWWRLGIR